MIATNTKERLSWLQILLRPIARFCLRHSLNIQNITEILKVVLLDVAAEEMVAEGEKVNISRLSVMTGLHRRDVMRIYRDKNVTTELQGLLSKVIGQWQHDKRFLTESKRPRVLTVDGEDNEFRRLVGSVSNDLHAGTVLFELERTGSVQRTKYGVKLLVRAFVPRRDPVSALQLLAKDTEDLATAVEENVFGDSEVPNLHARTEYDNIRADAIPAITQWLYDEGSAFHKKARYFLAEHDQDLNPDPNVKQSGVKVALGSFSRISGALLKKGRQDLDSQ